ncbi:hypothetical protein, partial [Kitasatospora sp. SC0581]|uniref:hypothetical protein n=1 Tax=Kitasatospora sp. SC0581 TaxID=3394360 RepID=UPI003A8B3F82
FGFSLLYGDKYSDYKYLTLILGIYELLLGINRPYIVGLRAINYTKPFFIGNLFTALVTSGLGMILSSYLSVFGSALSMIITTLFLSLYYILQHNKEVNLRIREEQERILTI